MFDDASLDQGANCGTAPSGMDGATNVHLLFHGRVPARRPVRSPAIGTGNPSEAAAWPRDRSAGAGWGEVLDFSAWAAHRFTPRMRASLERLAATISDPQAVSFGTDTGGVEWCRFGMDLTITWERPHGMTLTDSFSGYVDHGPFDSFDDICRIIEDLRL